MVQRVPNTCQTGPTHVSIVTLHPHGQTQVGTMDISQTTEMVRTSFPRQ